MPEHAAPAMSAPVPAAIDRMLDEARRRIQPRVRPEDLDQLAGEGALIVDTRDAGLRQRDGDLPGAVVIERNVLEWRLDPTSPYRLRDMDEGERTVVVVCDEGYASSLAAATLRHLGVNATDLDGGYQAWLALRRSATPDHH